MGGTPQEHTKGRPPPPTHWEGHRGAEVPGGAARAPPDDVTDRGGSGPGFQDWDPGGGVGGQSSQWEPPPSGGHPGALDPFGRRGGALVRGSGGGGRISSGDPRKRIREGMPTTLPPLVERHVRACDGWRDRRLHCGVPTGCLNIGGGGGCVQGLGLPPPRLKAVTSGHGGTKAPTQSGPVNPRGGGKNQALERVGQLDSAGLGLRNRTAPDPHRQESLVFDPRHKPVPRLEAVGVSWSGPGPLRVLALGGGAESIARGRRGDRGSGGLYGANGGVQAKA